MDGQRRRFFGRHRRSHSECRRRRRDPDLGHDVWKSNGRTALPRLHLGDQLPRPSRTPSILTAALGPFTSTTTRLRLLDRRHLRQRRRRSLTKTGMGTLYIQGSSGNTYTGLTTVTGGKVYLNKTSGYAIAGNLLMSAPPMLPTLRVLDQPRRRMSSPPERTKSLRPASSRSPTSTATTSAISNSMATP